MTGLVATVAEAFGMDVPVGTHVESVVPFGMVPRAFPSKTVLPIFSFLEEEIGDGGRILTMRLLLPSSAFLFLPPFFLVQVSLLGKTTTGFVWFVVGEWMKLSGRRMLRELFRTASMTGPKLTRQSSIMDWSSYIMQACNKHWVRISMSKINLVGKSLLAAMQVFKIILSHQSQ
jgi:hypothetical protein